MITRVSTVGEIKRLFIEALLNKSDKLTKVADESINNGIAYGVAKVAQKALKDIALVESHIFPDFAYGSHLDQVADRYGISSRFTASKSSTHIRIFAAAGTSYSAATQKFRGGGQTFDLLEDVTVGALGYIYAPIRSQNTGTQTNVDGLTINTVSPVPTGHLSCINEYAAVGGRDNEDDRLFKVRIKEGANIAARGTLAMLTQVFMKINTSVLKVYYHGVNNQMQPVLAVSNVTGANFTAVELDAFKQRSQEYLGLLELNLTSGIPNVEIKNIEYQLFDVSFRLEAEPGFSIDEIRKEIQIAFSKYADWRYWVPGRKIEWDDLLQIVKNNRKVRYVPDQHFVPNLDIVVDPTKLPRFRGLLIKDMNGNLLANASGTLNPVYYPNEPDENFNTTVLSSI